MPFNKLYFYIRDTLKEQCVVFYKYFKKFGKIMKKKTRNNL